MERDDECEYFEGKQQIPLDDFIKKYFEIAYDKYVEEKGVEESLREIQELHVLKEKYGNFLGIEWIDEIVKYGKRRSRRKIYTQKTLCEAKARAFREQLQSMLNEYETARPEFTNYAPRENDERLTTTIGLDTTDDYRWWLDGLLGDEYIPPDDIDSVMKQLFVLQRCYEYESRFSSIHPEMLDRLDVASFTLLPIAGQFCGQIQSAFRRLNHKEGVSEGKKQQKEKTISMILNAYKNLRAQWCDDELRNKPILLKDGRRVSRNKLYEEVFSYIKASSQPGVTKEHIRNLLIELHEKGEI